MSDVKWTPGPWRVGTHGPNGSYTVGTERGLMTAMIAHSVNHEDQRQEAKGNARLIAAAPELYSVLEAVREYLDDIADAEIPDPGGRTIANDEMKLLQDVESIMAKARGES